MKRSIELREVRACITWYNAISVSYDELYSEEQTVKYELIFNQLPKHITTILDVGCGTGGLFTYLAKREYPLKYYICLDVSDRIINIASSKIKYYEHLTDLIVADLTYPPIRTDYGFDLITLITVLKNSYNVDNIVKEYLLRVKDRGFIAYTILYDKVLRNASPKYEDIHIIDASGKTVYKLTL